MKIFAFTLASLLPVAVIAPLAAQSADRLVGKNVSIAQTNYKGRSAIQVIAKPEAANATSYALVKEVSFRDGVIEVDLAGQPAAGAFGAARGFIGIAFRVQGDGRYEYIYLRPTITLPNTVRIRILTSLDRGRRLPKSMSRTSICSRVSGSSTRSRWKAAKRGST